MKHIDIEVIRSVLIDAQAPAHIYKDIEKQHMQQVAAQERNKLERKLATMEAHLLRYKG